MYASVEMQQVSVSISCATESSCWSSTLLSIVIVLGFIVCSLFLLTCAAEARAC